MPCFAVSLTGGAGPSTRQLRLHALKPRQGHLGLRLDVGTCACTRELCACVRVRAVRGTRCSVCNEW
eukprot:1760638-Alexandrium_andersonii.AAC.1